MMRIWFNISTTISFVGLTSMFAALLAVVSEAMPEASVRGWFFGSAAVSMLGVLGLLCALLSFLWSDK